MKAGSEVPTGGPDLAEVGWCSEQPDAGREPNEAAAGWIAPPCGAHATHPCEGGDKPEAIAAAARGLTPWPMDRALALLTELRLMLPRVWWEKVWDRFGY